MTGAGAPERLRKEQYADSRRLEDRIALHRAFSTNQRGFAPWLMDQLLTLGLPQGARVLEVGCGPGTLWLDNAGRVPKDWRLLLSDFSTGMVETTRQRWRSAALPSASFFAADAAHLPCEDERFDAVLANHMLYHVGVLSAALSEIERVLRPDGVLFASALATTTMRELEAIIRNETRQPGFRFMRDAARFPLDGGAELLEPYFQAIEVRDYPDSLEITEAEPVIAYIESMIRDEPWSASELAAIRTRVLREIDRHGALHVSKQSGVFIARKRH